MKARATARLEEALAASELSDPREVYRAWLRDLRERDPAALEESVRYFEETLVPRVADEGSDPVLEWLEYGRFIAQRMAPGRTVEVEPGGRARPFQPTSPRDRLVLHLPDDSRRDALVVGMPRGLSSAQRATYDLLVGRRTTAD